MECCWEVGGSQDGNVSDTCSNNEAVVDLGKICLHGVICAEASCNRLRGVGECGDKHRQLPEK